MTYESIKIILNKYNITTIDQLEYCLSVFDSNDECLDDPNEDEKNCMNAKCYEYGVPDCRKIVEIYNKYFQKDISKKDIFVSYLEKNTSKSKSSIANYLSCKSCNQQIKKRQKKKLNSDAEEDFYINLKISDSDFKKDFCNNLSIKFSYESLFQTEYKTIKQFLNKEHQITSDTFMPKYIEKDNTMTKDEEKRLFEISHTSKDEFKLNLQDKENLKGSYIYLLNLAINALDRNIINECEIILNEISNKFKDQLKSENYIQLKVKVLSLKQKDKEAIFLLKELIKEAQSRINPETYNLLAASIKRDAFSEYNLYKNEKILIDKLIESKDIYYSVYKLTNDYYPALNYIYLLFMLAHINNEKQEYFENILNESEEIWKNVNLQIKDWWSYISNIEFLILTEKYNEAKKLIEGHFKDLDKDEITDFNTTSTLRQLNLYFENFCKDKRLKEIIDYITKISQ